MEQILTRVLHLSIGLSVITGGHIGSWFHVMSYVHNCFGLRKFAKTHHSFGSFPFLLTLECGLKDLSLQTLHYLVTFSLQLGLLFSDSRGYFHFLWNFWIFLRIIPTFPTVLATNAHGRS